MKKQKNKHMIYFIGLGLDSEKDLTLKAIEILKKCDKVYLEYYTQPMINLNIKNLENLINKKIEILERENMENRMNILINESKEKNIAIIIGGDPFVATTHNIFIPELKKRNIKFEVIHNASIFTAVCKCGLEIYKFGEVTTIPFHYEKVISPIEKINRNKKSGLHTLVLLDLNKKEDKYLDIKEALNYLEKHLGKNEDIITFSKVGSNEEKIMSGKIKDLKLKDLGNPPFCIVIPGKMNIVEEECFESYKN